MFDKLLELDKINFIYKKIKDFINNNFINLISEHKQLIINNLLKLILLTTLFFQHNEHEWYQQYNLNDSQDIKSLFVLLMPYFDLKSDNGENNCHKIISLDNLFLNNNKIKEINCFYYIDHNIKINYNEYFDNILRIIANTYSIINNKLMSNWINIFPYTMDTYIASDIYINFKNFYSNRSIPYDNDNIIRKILEFKMDIDNTLLNSNDEFFILGHDVLFNTLNNFLYNDIVNIKWLIYDINIDMKILPTVILLGENLKINNIANKPYNELTEIEIKNIEINWYKMINNKKLFLIIKSLLIFYSYYLNIISILNLLNINNLEGEIDDYIHENIYENNIFKQIIKDIKFELIYKFIYESIQQFKYTWYGYICLDSNNNILSIEDYFLNYKKIFKNQHLIIGYMNEKLYYLTPKMIYNYIKYLVNFKNTDRDEFIQYSKKGRWNNIILEYQNEFIDKINFKIFEFRISNNLKKIYKSENINDLNKKIKDTIKSNNIIVDVIIQTLVYNGILTYYIYNPKLSDSKIIPNKNKNTKLWEKYMLDNINISNYENAYHYLNNKQIICNENMIETFRNSKPFNIFGTNWIAQIQLYYHYINQRIIYITGATGVGKSTIAPLNFLYSLKICDYNNNGKIYCTEPRIQPTTSNADQISKFSGIPIYTVEDDGKTIKKDINGKPIIKNINYIQYEYSEDRLTDNSYHLKLILTTDGTFYNKIKSNYVFKENFILENYLSNEDTILLLTNELTNLQVKIFENFKNKYSNCSNYKFELKLIDKNVNNYHIEYYGDKYLIENIDDLPFFIIINKEKKTLEQYHINNIFENNICDILLIDESHEHNIYMDLILTLSKFGIYINNQITLGIISATMEEDEKIYRKYYNNVDDNWKYPLDLSHIKDNNLYKMDRNLLDRRLHLSIPFGGMNFTVTEFNNFNSDPILVLEHIFKISKNGDILIFDNGQNEIIKLVEKINSNKNFPSNVLAVPFFSSLEKDKLDIIKSIDAQEKRNLFRYKKIDKIDNIFINKDLSENYYKRFIIVATNIAEASITINSLEWVIDNGKQKINVFNINKFEENLKVVYISKLNQKQRKGRVGRNKPGTVFYMYDKNNLSDNGNYNICIQNISIEILNLLSENNSNKYFTSDNNPYLINDLNSLDIRFLLEQYTFRNISDGYSELLLYNRSPKEQTIIFYPDSKGKFDYETLIDKNGLFYIIHPNQNLIIKDDFMNSINIINSQINNVSLFINHYRNLNIISKYNTVSKYGINVQKIIKNFEKINGLENNLILYNLLFLNLNIYIYVNLILFIVFKQNKFNFLKLKITVNADYLLILGLLDYKYFLKNISNEDLNKVNNYNNKEDVDNEKKLIIEKITFNINNEIEKIKIELIKINKETIFKIIESFYSIKFEIEIFKYSLMLDKKQNYYFDNIKNKNINKIIKLNIYNLFEDNIYKLYSNYEQTCYYICKNFYNNILIKIPKTNYYIKYFNPNINYIYKIKSSFNKIDTNINKFMVNNIIFALDIDENMSCSNIFWIPQNIIDQINYNIQINNKIDINIQHELYDKKELILIYQNINIISNFIEKLKKIKN